MRNMCRQTCTHMHRCRTFPCASPRPTHRFHLLQHFVLDIHVLEDSLDHHVHLGKVFVVQLPRKVAEEHVPLEGRQGLLLHFVIQAGKVAEALAGPRDKPCRSRPTPCLTQGPPPEAPGKPHKPDRMENSPAPQPARYLKREAAFLSFMDKKHIGVCRSSLAH